MQALPRHSRRALLIVDDEAAQMKALCDTLREQGYETTGFSRGRGGAGRAAAARSSTCC